MKVPPLTVAQMELLLEVCKEGRFDVFENLYDADELVPLKENLGLLEGRDLIRSIRGTWVLTDRGSRMIDQMKALTTVP